MKNKTQLILAALCAAPIVHGITYLDETVAGISLIDNGASQADSYEIVSDLDLGTEFPGETEFVLPAVVFVNNGATLTIPAGSIMRGQPRITSGLSDAPGALVVTTEGMIDAVGTATSPIIWTTAATGTIGNVAKYTKGDSNPNWLDPDPLLSPLPPQIDNTNVTQLWGGVALLGKSLNNLAGTTSGQGIGIGVLEGLPTNAGDNAYYGGKNPNDSSGRMIYNSIRHNGDILAAGSEIQGLTLGSAGYGTELSYIEIYCSGDDGIEIFGGTSFLDHILISFAEDDSLDLDQGWSGAAQFLCVIMPDNDLYSSDGNGTVDAFGGDYAGEWDGDDFGEDPSDSTGIPLTYPTIYNATFVGAAPGESKGLDADTGWGGNLYNSLVYNFPTYGFDYSGGGFPGTNPADRIAAGTIDFSGVAFKDSPARTADNTFATQVLAAGTNNITSATYTMVSNDQTVGNNGLIPLPTGAPLEIIVSPANGFGVGYTSTFFEAVPYKGAFSNSTSAILWTTGWTALNHLDMIPDRGDGVEVDGI